MPWVRTCCYLQLMAYPSHYNFTIIKHYSGVITSFQNNFPQFSIHSHISSVDSRQLQSLQSFIDRTPGRCIIFERTELCKKTSSLSFSPKVRDISTKQDRWSDLADFALTQGASIYYKKLNDSFTNTMKTSLLIAMFATFHTFCPSWY